MSEICKALNVFSNDNTGYAVHIDICPQIVWYLPLVGANTPSCKGV